MSVRVRENQMSDVEGSRRIRVRDSDSAGVHSSGKVLDCTLKKRISTFRC